jgi:benzoyl-CoA-dihydrodiol lyase
VDKRRVRRDLADVFCTTEEGVKGRRAREWNLVDELVPRSRLDEAVRRWTDQQPSPAAAGEGISLRRIEREERPDGLAYSTLILSIDRQLRAAMLTVRGPARVPATPDELQAEGGGAWVIAAGRELDDAILHLRFNEPAIGTLIFKTRGDIETVLAYDAFLAANRDHWLAREAVLLWKQVLQRIDLTSRSLVALVEPGSCFGGTMAELAFAADRSYMLLSDAPFAVSAANFGWYPMTNGQCRLAQRLPELDAGSVAIGCPIAGETAEASGLVTFALDEVDWEDEIRIFLEERAAFSPDALTAMEANLRFAGPETMESKIFARLSAWQNWVFQRPNAVGPEGALQRYGTGQKPAFDRRRV